MLAGLGISLCKNLLRPGMGASAAAEAFEMHSISEEEFKLSSTSIIKNENLVVRIHGKYLPWDKAAPIVLGMAVYGVELTVEPSDTVPVEQEDTIGTTEGEPDISSTASGRGWRLWAIPFRRVKTVEHTSSNSSNEDVFTDPECVSQRQSVRATSTIRGKESPHKQLMRTNVPTSDQIASLGLKDGQNLVTFISNSRVLGPQKVSVSLFLNHPYSLAHMRVKHADAFGVFVCPWEIVFDIFVLIVGPNFDRLKLIYTCGSIMHEL